MTMITPSYLGETIEYSSLHACRSTLEDPMTLVGPEYPVNVGYTARLLKNFGVKKLYLVGPRFDRRVASVYASHGSDLIDEAEVVDLAFVREHHDLLVATTAIKAIRKANVNRLTIKPEEVANYVRASKNASLVFGRDTTGLRNEEIAQCDITTTIDSGTSYSTLNVSHAVAILLYLIAKSGSSTTMAQPSLAMRDAFATYSYKLAILSGLQISRADRVRKLSSRVALRSNLNDKDIGMLLSLMRKAAVTISKQRTLNQTRSKT